MHGAAAWFTVNVWPPIATVPVRAAPYWQRRCRYRAVAGAARRPVNVIEPALDVADHVQPARRGDAHSPDVPAAAADRLPARACRCTAPPPG